MIEPADSRARRSDPNVAESETWQDVIDRHKGSVWTRSVWQLCNSVIPYIALWVAMVWLAQVSYWLVLPTALLASGFLVRIFIIFHDCTHGSFFTSKKANEIVGFTTGLMTFTPFHQWRRLHAIHHGTAGNLDRRGSGDVWTLTVQEYLEATRWKRLGYRVARNPLVLFVLAPLYLFLIEQRFPSSRVERRHRRWLHWTNFFLVAVAVVMCLSVGWQVYLLAQLTVIVFASGAGVWLFYVQHQFEGVYWERNQDWSFEQAALAGSSFYELPGILKWFSGNIGFHHLHHLSPMIPNYRLEACNQSHRLFQQVKSVTLWSSLKCLSLRLWDEQEKRLISYRELRRMRRLNPAPTA